MLSIKYSYILEKLTFWIVASIGYGWWVGSLHLICWIKNYHIVHNTLANLMSVKFQPWNGWRFESGNLQVTEVNWPVCHLLFCVSNLFENHRCSLYTYMDVFKAHIFPNHYQLLLPMLLFMMLEYETVCLN